MSLSYNVLWPMHPFETDVTNSSRITSVAETSGDYGSGLSSSVSDVSSTSEHSTDLTAPTNDENVVSDADEHVVPDAGEHVVSDSDE